jgi:dTDP-4-dehydrorhamnose 3,5-epimerase
MEVKSLHIEGCFLIQPTLRKDDRGSFMESFNQLDFERATGITTNFVQDNQSFSYKGVLRGLHYQLAPYAQAKLVRVVHGTVFDVAVDIRPNSPSYGQYETAILSAENNLQFYIPRGFAHGFLVLSETAIFCYKCDSYYSYEHEAGIIYDDPEIAIPWPLEGLKLKISDKDQGLPTLKYARKI